MSSRPPHTRRTRVAIVGLGQGIEDVLACLHHPHLEVAALCDLHRTRYDGLVGNIPFGDAQPELSKFAHVAAMAESLRQHFTHEAPPRFESDFRTLLDDPEIDAVSLAVPSSLHADFAIAALERGKFVLCAKPLTRSLADAQRLRAVACRHPTRFMVALQYRHTELARHICAIGASGEIGPFRTIQLQYHRGPFRAIYRSKRDSDGSIVEEGTHFLDLLCRLNQEARFTQVFGSGSLSKNRDIQEIDDNGAVIVDFENDVRGIYHYSYFGSHRTHFRIFIQGELGQIDGDFDRLIVDGPNGPREVSLQPASNTPVWNHQGYAAMWDAFATMIVRRQEPIASIRNSFHTYCLTLAAQRAVNEHRAVARAEIDATAGE